MIPNSQSTVTLQDEVDILQTFGDLEPILNVGGQTSRVILTAANNVMNAICAVQFPHKWNEANAPQFYINSLQQDYAVVNPNGSSLTNLAWLERGIVVDINNTAEPKPWRLVETGRELTQSTGTMFNSSMASPLYLVNWLPNSLLYYGNWGAGNGGSGSFGNNPDIGSVYMPLVALGKSLPLNPIMQIQDANGNLLLLTGFGTEGTSAPLAAPNATPGTQVSGSGPAIQVSSVAASNGASAVYTYTTAVAASANNAFLGVNFAVAGFANASNNGNFICLASSTTSITLTNTAAIAETIAAVISSFATTTWTVLDPNGQGFRILPCPAQSGIIWQFNLVYQMKPVRFTSVQQTLAPFPDDFEPHFQMGLIAQLYRFSPLKAVYSKFEPAWQHWLRSLVELRAKEDRETEENTFVPDRGILGGAPGRNRFLGPQFPFNYPTR
jgi:hypothetical protein